MRGRSTAALAAAGLAAATVVAGVPASAGPAGTHHGAAGGTGHPVAVSAPRKSKYSKSFYVDAANTTWVVFSVLSKTYAEPSDGGPLVPLPDADATIYGDDIHVVGDLVTYPGTHHRTLYYDLATKTPGMGSNRWAAASPYGGVYGALDKADGKIHGYEQDAGTGTITDLGVLAGFNRADYVGALANENGVVFQQNFGNNHNRASYVAFDSPGTVTPLQNHDQGDQTCLSLTSNALGCASAGRTIYRIPLDGSAALTRTIALPKHAKASGAYSLVFVTPGRTYWGIDYDEDDHEGYDGPAPAEPLRSVPANAPHAQPTATAFTLPTVQDSVVTGGSTVYFDYDDLVTTAGIYRLSADHMHRAKFHHVGAENVLSTALGLGSGQAVFEDNPDTSGTRLRTRLFTRSAGTVSPGRIVDLGHSVDDIAPVGVSASRVLYESLNGVHVVSVAGSGKAHESKYYRDDYTVALSGTRAIVYSFHAHHYHDLLLNLVTGHTTDLVAEYGVLGTPALFGNYLAYGTKDGSVRRLDLATGKSVTLAGPTKASRGKTLSRIVEWGNDVAWAYAAGDVTYSSYLRNARTMTPRVALPRHDYIVGASADGVTLRTAGTKTHPTLVRPFTSNTVRPVYSGKALVASSVAAYTVAAGDPDLPGGTVYAKPSAHAYDRPRSLGNPFGAGSVRRGHRWHFDLPTSANLTSCTVSIRRHGHSVRTLPCAHGLMALGEVSVSWNGRTRAGHQAARGTYHAVVSASNADGTLLAANGSPAATAATVKIR